MLGTGQSKHNTHTGQTTVRQGDMLIDGILKVRSDLEVGGNLSVDGTINLTDVTVDGNLTINPPNCLNTDCINPATPATGIEINNEYKLPIVKGTSNQVLTQIDALGNCEFSDIPNSSTTIPLDWRLLWYGQGRTNPYNTFVFNSLVGGSPIGPPPTLNNSNFLRDAILYQESSGRFEVTYDGSNNVTLQFKFTYLNNLIQVDGFTENLVYTNSFTGFFKITHYIYNLFSTASPYPLLYSLVTLEINDPSNTSNRYLASWIGENFTTQNGLFPDTSGVPINNTSITQYDLQVSPSFGGTSSVNFYPSGINVWIGADYRVTASGGVGGVVTNPLTENLVLGGFSIIEPLGAVSPSLNIDQLDNTKDIKLKVAGLPNITIKDLNTQFNKNIDLDSNDIINGNDVKSNQVSVDTLTSKSGGNITVNKNVNIGTKSIIDGANNIIDFLGGNMTLLNTSPTNSIAIAAQKDVLINAFNEIKISNPPTSTRLSITPTTSTLSNDLVQLTANNGVSINETTSNMFVAVVSSRVFIAQSNDPSPPTQIASFEPTLIELKQDLRIQESIIYVKPNTMPIFFISDTTYIFVGSRNTSNSYTLPDNCKICGLGKNNSSINYNGGSTLFSSVDNNLEVCNITLTSSNIAGKLFDLSNVAQNRTINFTGLQIRNTKNGMLIDGYDLIDFNNCIFTYFETGSLTPIGINISNGSKVQLSSCEFLRWFQEGGVPASTFFNGNMLQFTGILNALNLNGSFFHPQYDQNGIDLSAVSSVLEGTITSNTFIDINLNSPTFQVLVPPIPSIAANYVIESNSIYPNLKSQVTYVLSAVNTTATDLSVNNPNVINHNNLALPLTIQFATIGTNGLITYTKKRSANFMIVATCNLELVAGTNNRIGLGLFVNGSAVPLAYSYVNLSASGTANQKPATLSFTGQANLNDTFQLSVFNATASNNVIVNDVNFAGIEI